jgi:hypothetical protein
LKKAKLELAALEERRRMREEEERVRAAQLRVRIQMGHM